MNKCIDCNIEIKKYAKRCVPCGNNMNRRRSILAKAKNKKEIQCLTCGITFMPYERRQKTCTKVCKEKHKTILSNQDWLKKTGKPRRVAEQQITKGWVV